MAAARAAGGEGAAAARGAEAEGAAAHRPRAEKESAEAGPRAEGERAEEEERGEGGVQEGRRRWPAARGEPLAGAEGERRASGAAAGSSGRGEEVARSGGAPPAARRLGAALGPNWAEALPGGAPANVRIERRATVRAARGGRAPVGRVLGCAFQWGVPECRWWRRARRAAQQHALVLPGRVPGRSSAPPPQPPLLSPSKVLGVFGTRAEAAAALADAGGRGSPVAAAAAAEADGGVGSGGSGGGGGSSSDGGDSRGGDWPAWLALAGPEGHQLLGADLVVSAIGVEPATEWLPGGGGWEGGQRGTRGRARASEKSRFASSLLPPRPNVSPRGAARPPSPPARAPPINRPPPHTHNAPPPGQPAWSAPPTAGWPSAPTCAPATPASGPPATAARCGPRSRRPTFSRRAGACTGATPGAAAAVSFSKARAKPGQTGARGVAAAQHWLAPCGWLWGCRLLRGDRQRRRAPVEPPSHRCGCGRRRG